MQHNIIKSMAVVRHVVDNFKRGQCVCIDAQLLFEIHFHFCFLFCFIVSRDPREVRDDRLREMATIVGAKKWPANRQSDADVLEH